ncbi:MAG: hypothetical protein OER97_08835 [Gammaproteobacteria bacterium]|nr:hypothetical protein [Gammaproteobacteria bacterium]
MRPLMVINGFLFGSCVSIVVSLMFVLVVFIVIGDDYPRVQYEFRPLLSSMFIFLGMTIISAGSFYSLVIGHRTRIWLQGLMWVGLAATGWHFWP